MTVGGVLVADEIGDGSSREQAASCQKVLGGFANLANAYATKRYRSNCINWGLLPLRTDQKLNIPTGCWLLLADIRGILENEDADGFMIRVLDETVRQVGDLAAELGPLTVEERQILAAGCLINEYKQERVSQP